MRRREQWGGVALVLIFAALVASTQRAVPLFETPDEGAHLAVMRAIARHRALPSPVLPKRIDPDWLLQFHDPPLYYAPPLYHALGACLVLLTHPDSLDELPHVMIPSPNWAVGWAPQPGRESDGKNVYAHRVEEWKRSNPVVGTVYLLRGFSMGLGALTVACTYALAKTLFPSRPCVTLGATAIVAFNPAFIFVSSGVTNDNLVNALTSLTLWNLVRLVQKQGRTWQWAVAGVLVGLGLLTKQNVLMWLPLGLLAVLMAARRGKTTARDAAVFLLPAITVSGWWYLRNGFLYGDPLGFAPHVAVQRSLSHFGLSEMVAIFRSYWAVFGWSLIWVEPWIYVALALLSGLALVGGGLALRDLSTGQRRGIVLLALAVSLNCVALARWAIATGASYGRLLFSTVTATAVLMAWGMAWWGRWLPSRVGRWSAVALAGGLLAFAVLVPTRYLRPVYCSPARFVEELPSEMSPLETLFAGRATLVGYHLGAQRVSPGDVLPVTLCWRGEGTNSERYRVAVQLAPRDPTQRVADKVAWLGSALHPSDLWQNGDLICQSHRLSVPDWAPAPALYWVRVWVLDEEGSRLDKSAVLGPLVMYDDRSLPPPARPVGLTFGGAWELVGLDIIPDPVQAGETLSVQLQWRAQAALPEEYTVFVHLRDTGGHLITQHDAPPRNGDFPTSWWRPGDVIQDIHLLAVPPGTAPARYRLVVGLYRSAGGTRLPVTGGDNEVEVAEVDVVP